MSVYQAGGGKHNPKRMQVFGDKENPFLHLANLCFSNEKQNLVLCTGSHKFYFNVPWHDKEPLNREEKPKKIKPPPPVQ